MKMSSVVVVGLCGVAACINAAHGETVFSGLDYTFFYEGGGDVNDPANQDRITDNVWITRGSSRGIFNIAQEDSYQGSGSSGPSPIGTQWAFGTTADYDTLSYMNFAALHDGSPPTLIGQDVVVHLVDDDIYIDLRFTDWFTGGVGGFGYVRSSVPAPASGALLALGGLVATRRRR